MARQRLVTYRMHLSALEWQCGAMASEVGAVGNFAEVAKENRLAEPAR